MKTKIPTNQVLILIAYQEALAVSCFSKIMKSRLCVYKHFEHLRDVSIV